MKTIDGIERFTEDEAKAIINSMVKNYGPNEACGALSYRKNGVPGNGGGTIAISFIRPKYRKGVAYYNQVPFAA